MKQRTLVLAEVWGYKVAVYQLFILSLLNTGYNGDIKLLAPPNRTRPEVMAWLDKVHVEVTPLDPSRWHSSDRFWQYSSLCSGGGYSWCLAADFRDVVFQSDPFEHVRFLSRTLPHADMPDLILPAEHGRFVRNDSFNAGMLEACYGRGVLRTFEASAAVLCSGVLLGNAAAFAALPHLLVPLAHRCPADKMSDQAALNLLIHTQRHTLVHPSAPSNARFTHGSSTVISSASTAGGGRGMSRGRTSAPPHARSLRVAIESGGSGFTSTIGVFKGRAAGAVFARARMRDGLVLNDNGRPSPVVHQWDRLLFYCGPHGAWGGDRGGSSPGLAHQEGMHEGRRGSLNNLDPNTVHTAPAGGRQPPHAEWSRSDCAPKPSRPRTCYTGLDGATGAFEERWEAAGACPPGHVRFAAVDRVLEQVGHGLGHGSGMRVKGGGAPG